MREAIYSEPYKKILTIKVYHDENGGENIADEQDDALFLVGFHRDFSVERAGLKAEQVAAILRNDVKDEEYGAEVKEWRKKYHVFGLEAYIHSGVVLALSNEGGFPDRRWDVSQLGAVFVSRKEWPTKAKARKAAQGHIAYWNDALRGNVYGYVIENSAGEHLTSCWGYFGDYDSEGGALDEAREEAAGLLKMERQRLAKERKAAKERQHKIDSIRQWLKDYDENEEHDMELAINLKDDAAGLLEFALGEIAGRCECDELATIETADGRKLCDACDAKRLEDEQRDEEACIKCGKSGGFADGICNTCADERGR